MKKQLLEKAKHIIRTTNTVFAFVSEDETLLSDAKGIGFAAELCNQKKDLSNGCVADKIVGKAAALLFVYLGVKCVYADVMSEGAELVFKEFGIEYSFGTKTKNIINRKGDGLCPMENAVINIGTPEKALLAVNDTLQKLKSK